MLWGVLAERSARPRPGQGVRVLPRPAPPGTAHLRQRLARDAREPLHAACRGVGRGEGGAGW